MGNLVERAGGWLICSRAPDKVTAMVQVFPHGYAREGGVHHRRASFGDQIRHRNLG
jgi:hypothetical protein